jgi:hypothetical protein
MANAIYAAEGALVNAYSPGGVSSSSSSSSTTFKHLLKSRLNAVADWQPGTAGQSILAAMGYQQAPSSSSSSSVSQFPPGTIPMAILQSLFTPCRQLGMPSCNMHAIINSEIADFPGRLAGVYGQILTTGTNAPISLPSTATITAAAVIPYNDEIFIEIKPKKPDAIDNRKYLLDNDTAYRPLDGIKDINNNSDNNIIIGLKHPVRDLNDAFLANFAHAVYNKTPEETDHEKLIAIRKIIEAEVTKANNRQSDNSTQSSTNSEENAVVDDVSAASAFIFSRRLYYGVDGDRGFVSNGAPIDVPATMNLAQAKQFVQNLKTRTEGHRNNGLRRATFFSQKKPTANAELYAKIGGLNPTGHIENLLDVDAINYLNPDTMSNKTFHVIGERTWVDQDGRIEYLALVRTGNNEFELTSRLLHGIGISAKTSAASFNEMRIYEPR